jgi:DnaK suppressor protein
MLSLPQKTLDKIKKLLLRQQKEVTEQIKTMETDDPVLAEGLAESPESGTESWAADVHARFVSVRSDLSELSKRIASSLMSIRKGTYGKCESCGKQIEPARLEAMPTATLCLSCSKKPKSKGKPQSFKR